MLALLLLTNLSYSHSGGTDAYGCHAGSRPYHCHGGSVYYVPVETPAERRARKKRQAKQKATLDRLNYLAKSNEAIYEECSKKLFKHIRKKGYSTSTDRIVDRQEYHACMLQYRENSSEYCEIGWEYETWPSGLTNEIILKKMTAPIKGTKKAHVDWMEPDADWMTPDMKENKILHWPIDFEGFYVKDNTFIFVDREFNDGHVSVKIYFQDVSKYLSPNQKFVGNIVWDSKNERQNLHITTTSGRHFIIKEEYNISTNTSCMQIK